MTPHFEQSSPGRASAIDKETVTCSAPLQFDSGRNNQPGQNRLNWEITPVLVLFHVGAVAALFFFSWRGLFVAMFLFWVTGGLGLGICFHRLLTHRSFATPKWFEYFLTICARHGFGRRPSPMGGHAS